VIAALAALTAIEFWVAVSLDTVVNPALAVIAVIKALLILEYFMHYSQLWNRPEDPR
jgi:heme/copper-type cytochrome/quinol oxidase subunit 4